MLVLLAACRPPDDPPAKQPSTSSSTTFPSASVGDAVVDYEGVVEPFGRVESTAWIEERVEAYGEVYVEHYLAASNRPGLCAAARGAAADMRAAWDDFSILYEDPYAYSYEEQCRLVQELAARFGEALDPFQSAGSQVLALEAQHPDVASDEPPPPGSYTAVPLDDGWDYDGPRLFGDLMLYTVNPFATAAERIDCAADPYFGAHEFDLAEDYTEWHYVEEGTLELVREGDTYVVDLDGTVPSFEDEPAGTVRAHYQAAHCVVDLPNADVELFFPFR